MHNVHQTDFSAGSGNALQACVASVFDLGLEEVPNFVKKDNYLSAMQTWLAMRGLTFLKVPLLHGALSFPPGERTTCLLAGNSPRGDFRHVIVAETRGNGFHPLHDPHPDATFLRGDPTWAGFFVVGRPEL